VSGDDLDLDALLAPQRWDKNRCTVAQALADIGDDKKRAKVAAAADHPLVPPSKVREAFKHLIGDTPADLTIRRHRNRGCTCP
jgi:methylphosphotriester-DNA--protein-cysteine methyltransferase